MLKNFEKNENFYFWFNFLRKKLIFHLKKTAHNLNNCFLRSIINLIAPS